MATIFALASASGRAGVALVRISGKEAAAALWALSGKPTPAPRRATLRRLHDLSGERLDDALVLWFPAPHSYTGEDIVELHLHGGRAVVAGVLEALAAMPGLRPAEPGEFTRRAFDNGKLDLAEVEGLGDLIEAETAGQRRQALRQLDGGLSALVEEWRGRLVRILAHLEADIDFPDEDLPEGVAAAVAPEIAALAVEMRRYLNDGRRGEILREGFHIAILGPPNAGKSSLLNWLARRDAAIVADTAGTTRDVVEVRLDLGGWPVVVADTAGLRESTETVELEGMRRARARAETADLVIALLDASRWPETDPEVLQAMGGAANVLPVLNKIDLGAPAEPCLEGQPVVPVSVRTGENLDRLLQEIQRRVAAKLDGGGEAPVLTRLRHREAVAAGLAALERFTDAPLPELAAEEVRLAARALGRITGKVDVEDLLDVIFRDFCIGK